MAKAKTWKQKGGGWRKGRSSGTYKSKKQAQRRGK